MIVIKRDGTEVDFKPEKIKAALQKTNLKSEEMSEEDLDRIVSIIEKKCEKLPGEKISVEEIQDAVENTLLKSKFNKTAKLYILYRDQRTRTRQSKTKLIKEISKKLKGSEIVNQNANIDEASFGGRKGEASSELTKQYALDYCISEMARNNHINNEIYIHKQNCGLSW